MDGSVRPKPESFRSQAPSSFWFSFSDGSMRLCQVWQQAGEVNQVATRCPLPGYLPRHGLHRNSSPPRWSAMALALRGFPGRMEHHFQGGSAARARMFLALKRAARKPWKPASCIWDQTVRAYKPQGFCRRQVRGISTLAGQRARGDGRLHRAAQIRRRLAPGLACQACQACQACRLGYRGDGHRLLACGRRMRVAACKKHGSVQAMLLLRTLHRQYPCWIHWWLR